LHEIEEGNKSYLQYSAEVGIATTKLNLMELYYSYLKISLGRAEKAFEDFREFCIEINDETMKEAALFRHQLKEKSNKCNVSFVDCIGYLLAKKLKMKFLTGDKEFRNLDNVEFVP
jgi:uncharacterized protein